MSVQELSSLCMKSFARAQEREFLEECNEIKTQENEAQ
jgi:hypothetical protein